MTEYTFINREDGDEVMVEAEGFEEACNLMFGDLGDGTKPYDYNKYELHMIDDEFRITCQHHIVLSVGICRTN